ncbi:MAG: M48 family metallopeptidase [Candidatus Cloacimonetes bacterium]|nr:M48 family metallopeptidase [Candidatus Cloacimonadota bacterium]
MPNSTSPPQISSQITIADYKIDIVRKRIKNLNLSVFPNTGRIRLSAPIHLDDESIRQYITSKLAWIQKHLTQAQPVQQPPPQEYIIGTSIYLEGKRYLLNIIPNSNINRILLRDDGYIDLFTKSHTSANQRALLIKEWHRARLRARIEPLIAKWQEIIGVQAKQWAIKQMKTRWGTCNISAKRIWINLELAKKPDESLEYIIVHELMHLLERQHNARFKALMDQYLPDWRSRKERLNRSARG